jgi:site-specific DNA recombinase
VKSGAKSPSRNKSASSRRAIGIVRVSRVGGRDGETFVSPGEQKRRIEDACSRDHLKLVDVLEELDVSGGAPLASRPGLRRAVEMVEAEEADVIVAAYFDRLVRSLNVQAEVVSRVEGAGGAILAVDIGHVSHGSSAQWLSGTMLGAVSEYHRRVTAERTQDAKRRAIARGVPTFAKIPPGLVRVGDGSLELNPKQARVVREAFKLRAKGATVMEVRDYLRHRGIERSFHGTTSMLANRMYLGELRFGDLVNPDSHAAIVDSATFAAVQKMRSPRGRRAKSERLLARLGVLRCGTCGARMVVGTANHGNYNLYRCPPIGDCPQRVTIGAEIAEDVIVAAVKKRLKGVRGTATLDKAADTAARELETAENELNAAIEAFSGLEDVAAARDRLNALRETRDEARERLEELQEVLAPAVTVTAEDWDLLTLEEQRALIRAVIAEARVAPGKGPERIMVEPR